MLKWVIFTAILALVAGLGAFLGFRQALNEMRDTSSVFDTFEQAAPGWVFSDKIGAAGAQPIQRARVALGGPLGLSADEVVYYIATADSSGAPLSSSCTYRVDGVALDTRWWSITLYDSVTQNYVPNDQKRSSWNSAAIPRDSGGQWNILVSPTSQDGTWLPSHIEPDQQFELNLRLYNPSDATRVAGAGLALPTVERVAC